MKMTTYFPVIAVAVIATGCTVFALAADEAYYYQEPTLPPQLSTTNEYERSVPPSQAYGTDDWKETNGEADVEVNGEDSILLPAPRPVEEPMNGNGEWKEMNGDSALPDAHRAEQHPNGDAVLGTEDAKNGEWKEVEVNGEAEAEATVPAPYNTEQYRNGDGDLKDRNGNGDGEYDRYPPTEQNRTGMRFGWPGRK